MVLSPIAQRCKENTIAWLMAIYIYTTLSECCFDNIMIIIMLGAIDRGKQVSDSKYELRDVMQELLAEESTLPPVAMCQ